MHERVSTIKLRQSRKSVSVLMKWRKLEKLRLLPHGNNPHGNNVKEIVTVLGGGINAGVTHSDVFVIGKGQGLSYFM